MLCLCHNVNRQKISRCPGRGNLAIIQPVTSRALCLSSCGCRSLLPLGLAVVLSLGLLPFRAWAQGATAPQASAEEETEAAAPVAPGEGRTEGIEEILVRGQSQAGFGLEAEKGSVTAFSSEDLAALGIEDVTDLADFTPNLEIVSPGATTATFFIRGVGLSDFSANAAGAVAIYQDGVPMNSPPLQVSQIFDTMTVGVLKGPQGSGPGRNASAGAIKIVSQKPSLSDITGKLRVSFGQFVSDDTPGALLQDYEGGFGFPLIPDLAGARLAFRLTEAEPFFTNGCANLLPVGPAPVERGAPIIWNPETQRPFYVEGRGMPRVCNAGEPNLVPAFLPEHVGNRHNWAARGQVLIVPEWRTDVEILLNAHGSRRDQDGVFGQALGTGIGAKGLGGETQTRYQEPDQTEELNDIAAGFEPGIYAGLIDPNRPVGAEPTAPVGGGNNGNTFPENANTVLAAHRLGLVEAEPIFSENYATNRPLDIGPYRGDYNKVGRQMLDTWGGFVRATIMLDAIEVNATSAYDGYDSFASSDTDFTPDLSFEIESQNKAWQFFQDLNLLGELDNYPVSWNAGAYYLMETIENEGDIDLGIGGTPRILRSWEQELWSFGVYAGFEWEFMDDLTLIAGGRYNYERKRFAISEGVPPGTGIPIPGVPDPCFLPIPALAPPPGADPYPWCTLNGAEEVEWTAPTGTIELLYHFSDEATAYLKYNRGWKSGHFNTNGLETEYISFDFLGQQLNFAGPVYPRKLAEPEEIDAFEVGFQVTGWEGRAHLEGALFHYDYKNYQVFIFEDQGETSPPALEIINANDARVLGAELEIFLEPLIDFVPPAFDGMRFNLRAGWLESEFLDFQNTITAIIGTDPAQLTTDYTGNTLPNAPRFQVSGGVEWAVEIGRYGSLIPRYDFTWTDDVYFDPTEGVGAERFSFEDGRSVLLPENLIGQVAHTRHNVRVTYRAPSGKLEVTGWCRNLTDVRYRNYAFDVSTFRSNVISFVGDPRSCGAEVVFNW